MAPLRNASQSRRRLTDRGDLPLARNLADEIGGVHVQSACQVEHNRKCRYVLASFEKADVADVQVGQFRELLLRQAAFRA